MNQPTVTAFIRLSEALKLAKIEDPENVVISLSPDDYLKLRFAIFDELGTEVTVSPDGETRLMGIAFRAA